MVGIHVDMPHSDKFTIRQAELKNYRKLWRSTLPTPSDRMSNPWPWAFLKNGTPGRVCGAATAQLPWRSQGLQHSVRRGGRQAVALIDLDTVGPMALAAELGDAWRSWCNPAGEDEPEKARFDIELFRSSLSGFAHTAPHLSPIEWENLVPGIERICSGIAS